MSNQRRVFLPSVPLLAVFLGFLGCVISGMCLQGPPGFAGKAGSPGPAGPKAEKASAP